jgi:hypothetical protein
MDGHEASGWPERVTREVEKLLFLSTIGRDGTLDWPEFDPVERPVYQVTAQRHIEEPVMPAADFVPSLKDWA